MFENGDHSWRGWEKFWGCDKTEISAWHPKYDEYRCDFLARVFWPLAQLCPEARGYPSKIMQLEYGTTCSVANRFPRCPCNRIHRSWQYFGCRWIVSYTSETYLCCNNVFFLVQLGLLSLVCRLSICWFLFYWSHQNENIEQQNDTSYQNWLLFSLLFCIDSLLAFSLRPSFGSSFRADFYVISWIVFRADASATSYRVWISFWLPWCSLVLCFLRDASLPNQDFSSAWYL